ncbi:hypothetical protein GDO86_020023 [Hymenochirus boettgeri]|uniref:Uncharacterized protein n=1 Tax=Hymenochirus boettgeri TaxID=247094 RepID=A0A8T2IG16_9PIPI|nr:hypothetical protein GDO86_020023 [Hymenochirus boettgeri]
MMDPPGCEFQRPRGWSDQLQSRVQCGRAVSPAA